MWIYSVDYVGSANNANSDRSDPMEYNATGLTRGEIPVTLDANGNLEAYEPGSVSLWTVDIAVWNDREPRSGYLTCTFPHSVTWQ